ncbi:hypothetical protein M3Y94_00701800 [Aphelenchoides besseyi]|nr:hypothetical protein M3Y94_00701800 [Aphelenchoides besseyi]
MTQKYNSWEPLESFISCDETIAAFEEQLKAAKTKDSVDIKPESSEQKSQKRAPSEANEIEEAQQPSKKPKKEQEVASSDLSNLADPSNWKKERYRVEFDQSPHILGARRVNNELYILCAFSTDSNVETVEATPYEVVRQHCPLVLLDFWAGRLVLKKSAR